MRGSDIEDYTSFVRARSAALFRTALLLTGERHTADDLVQSTLERVYRNWRRVRSADVPEAYARRILVNLANDRWRRQRSHPEAPLPDDAGGGRVDPYQGVDVRDELMRTLQTLPTSMRTVLVLRYFEELSDVEIAGLMNTSASTVRSQASRGLAKLRSVVDRNTHHTPSGGAV
ncbi:SigE family RNA polymerase sigma factor [Kitasatospora sp. NBC_00240]|uniref:SigE family RNA polymerase sigma factor n=1 Tax=Kitasatospora sp. NBC_00240 TaxID=2903567 RepID=UPI002253C8AD|nr:SigE family RNA polymerase sigma factor [Kitasatospora sp. NBC_00240]MCX5214381.1 SigE family RNA polymerase sigma factor [Kitasatospora sp. NBC_00240]